MGAPREEKELITELCSRLRLDPVIAQLLVRRGLASAMEAEAYITQPGHDAQPLPDGRDGGSRHSSGKGHCGRRAHRHLCRFRSRRSFPRWR